LAEDDATVVGHAFGSAGGMADTPLADRVTVLETKMEKVDAFLENFDRTLEVHFRAQAEMLDERFVQVSTEMNRGFAGLQKDVTSLQKDVTSIQKEITILRQGITIILGRLR
jgi:uncharacterized membrane-anchored protein YhcB (DUF1043 family)